MNIIKKYAQKRLRKQLAFKAGFSMAEAPLVEKWINGDDTVVEELHQMCNGRLGFPYRVK